HARRFRYCGQPAAGGPGGGDGLLLPEQSRRPGRTAPLVEGLPRKGGLFRPAVVRLPAGSAGEAATCPPPGALQPAGSLAAAAPRGTDYSPPPAGLPLEPAAAGEPNAGCGGAPMAGGPPKPAPLLSGVAPGEPDSARAAARRYCRL